ncbi:MAG: 3-deoxy-manno-octulosonate cytidylyltransferase (CMP-KDO synthetase) [Bacteroidia bacterium]|jgi:3-deoxy-manno-octulosonate cytidylyltransferase (CMP-KDO synthetase)
MNNIVGIIPSRYASTRFPAKPLVDIAGKSMIQRVYEQAKKATSLSDVIVATDDQRIFNHVVGFGGKVVMTSTEHHSGTDRCAEVLECLSDVDVIINIQGDEPFIEPEQINQLAACFENSETQIGTLIKKMDSEEDLQSDTVVKVSRTDSNKAINFSRQAFSSLAESYKHIGIYAYRADTLKTVSKLPQSDRELTEKLEQLRWLDNSFEIQLAETEHESNSVDTPEDLAKMLSLMEKREKEKGKR